MDDALGGGGGGDMVWFLLLRLSANHDYDVIPEYALEKDDVRLCPTYIQVLHHQ